MRIVDIKTILFIFLFLPVAMFFCFGKNCLANENHLIISELLINGINGEEFIELYNPTSESISLKNYYFTYYSSGKNWTDSPDRKQKFPDTAVIETHKFYLIGLKGFNETIANWQPYTSAQLSNSNGSIVIFPDDIFEKPNSVDFVAWGNVENVGDGQELSSPATGKSLEIIDTSTDKWQESYIIGGTPGKENSKKSEEKEEEKKEEEKESAYSEKIILNEIYPAPDTKSNKEDLTKEFVEIKNISKEKIDFSKIAIKDEKNNKAKISKTKEVENLFVFFGSFSLNNDSGGDTVFLYDEKGNLIASQKYEKGKTKYAYARSENSWRWTSKATPGKENEFDKALSGKIKMPKEIYAGVYADFEAKADKDAKKFTWNFGDDHKSYQKKTRHKYEKPGTYKASLKITGEGEDALLNFTVKVEKFGKTKVKIISLSPNPRGKDSENEWIEILNATKKKINLKGWSVATGSKKLYNHPINKNFTLKAGETKKLTRDFCAFSLGNKEAKIELRYPDGKVADKIKYDHKNNSVSEDELFQKEGGSWKWIESQESKLTQKNSSEITPILEQVILQTEPAPEVKNAEFENTDLGLSSLGKYSENPTWRKKQETQITLLLSGSNISPHKMLLQNQGRVLGISTVRPVQDKTAHIKSSDKFWKKINAKLNQFILFF